MLAVATVSRAVDAAEPSVVWIEAESFDDVGSWSRDTQHVDVMGSVYLLATGLGNPVDDAVTEAAIPVDADYQLWVRCRDWLPSHSPGRFRVSVDGRESTTAFGKAEDSSDAWRWSNGGTFSLEAGKAEIRIQDLTGWNGRVDAIVLATGDFRPSDHLGQLAEQRIEHAGVSPDVKQLPEFDVVVIGAGPSGIGAAVAAARSGVRVALVQDRPVVGGNSSSEIMVPPMGYLGSPPDRINVTGLCEEMFPVQGWSSFADSDLMESVIWNEPNLTLMLNTRAYGVTLKSGATPEPLQPNELDGSGVSKAIRSVLAIDIRSGQRIELSAPIFIDCTGHGWIGYYAGAEYRHGQESRSQHGEALAPVVAGDRTQGNTLYNSVIVTRDQPVEFECPAWAQQWNESADFQPVGDHVRIQDPTVRPENYDRPAHGRGRNPGNNPDGDIVKKWYVEHGGMQHIIWDAERIRDELLMINLGLWNYAKNNNPATREQNRNRELVWMNYVPGVRESRRLIGPYIMTQNDWDEQIVHDDTVAFTDWGIDVHHPEGFWVDGNDCIHVYHGLRVSIPYRSLYSRNVTNLMMAGRCLSATHMAMGATRVMRPCMGMGQAAGTAAAIAVQNNMSPQGVHDNHIGLLQQTLMKDGCYLIGVEGCDPQDLAQSATVTASSERLGYEAGKVIDGFSRVADTDPHAWSAESNDPRPWIELQLDSQASRLNVMHITFAEQATTVVIEVDGRQVAAIRPTTNQRRVLVPLDLPEGATRVRLRLVSVKPICEIRLYQEPIDVIESLQHRLLPPPIQRPNLPGVFLDDTEAERQGDWGESTYTSPFYCSGYSQDNNEAKGDKSLTFRPNLNPGRYEIRLAYPPYNNRATNVPVTVNHTTGTDAQMINQQLTPSIDGRFVSLGEFTLDEDSSIIIGNHATDGYVVVDGIQFLATEP